MRLLALTAMMVDHVGHALFPGVTGFRLVGRLAFPLYCFLLAQGFRHTRDVKRYALRLLGFALISEIPYDLFLFNRLWSPLSQNVFFALLLGLLALCWVERTKQEGLWLPVLGAAALGIVALYLQVDYGFYAVLLVILFDTCRGHFVRLALGYLACALGFGVYMAVTGSSNHWVVVQLLGSLAALLPIYCYNGKLGIRKLRLLFYAAYPVHLLLLWWVRAMRLIPPYFRF